MLRMIRRCQMALNLQGGVIGPFGRNAIMFLAGLLLCALGTHAQTNPCADPHAPRVLINNSSSKNSSAEVAARLEPVGRFSAALERQYYASCVVKDVAIFDDPKNYPMLNGSMVLVVNAMPSLKRKGFVAVSIEFSVVRGPDAFDRMTVFTCPVLLEPDDTESDLNADAHSCLVGYNAMVDSMSKKYGGR
jgi:hypothetical protein